MKPVLLLDMDGPIADFDLKFWNECHRHGVALDIESLDDPKRKRFMTDNIPNKEDRAWMRWVVDHTRWFKDLPVTPGAKEGVAVLEEHFDVWVCTKPLEANGRCRDDKGFWLHRHFPQLEHKLIIAPDKSLVRGAILLDDAPKAEWFDTAEWMPVIFPSVFNADLYSGYPDWTWGDPIEDLLVWVGA